ncbi:hypothetical protein RMCBS344292_19081 [Rhizopus microsporus]|nr:hypothetical protein RMCBS344292_19081 [Rhizopus microsporus]
MRGKNKHLQKAQGDTENRRKWKTKAINCDRCINTFIQALSIDRTMVNQAAQTSDITDADNEVSLDIEADINAAATQQLTTLEDESVEQKADITRRRLNHLKSNIR